MPLAVAWNLICDSKPMPLSSSEAMVAPVESRRFRNGSDRVPLPLGLPCRSNSYQVPAVRLVLNQSWSPLVSRLPVADPPTLTVPVVLKSEVKSSIVT